MALKAAIERAGIGGDAVDEVIMGCVLQAGQGQNPARQAAIGAGLPVEIPAMTVNKVCASGLKSVALAAQAVMVGEDVYKRQTSISCKKPTLPRFTPVMGRFFPVS